MASKNGLIAAFAVGASLLLAGALIANLWPRWYPGGVALMLLGVFGHVLILVLGIHYWETWVGKAAVGVSVVVFGWVGLVIAFYMIAEPQP